MNNFPTIKLPLLPFFTRYVKKLHLLVRLIFTPNWKCKLKGMFSVLLRLIHFLDFQQVAHTTLLKVHKKNVKNVSLLVITSAVVFWNTFYVILHLYRTLVWSKALFKESILFLAESSSVPQFGPHRFVFWKGNSGDNIV